MIFGYNGEIRQITLPDPSDTSGYPRKIGRAHV